MLPRHKVELAAEIVHRAVDLRRRLRPTLPDAIVLATADREGCILVTRNSKDFDPQDPRVRIPYASSGLTRGSFLCSAEHAGDRAGMLVRRRLKDVAVGMGVDEFAPAGRRAPGVRWARSAPSR